MRVSFIKFWVFLLHVVWLPWKPEGSCERWRVWTSEGHMLREHCRVWDSWPRAGPLFIRKAERVLSPGAAPRFFIWETVCGNWCLAWRSLSASLASCHLWPWESYRPNGEQQSVLLPREGQKMNPYGRAFYYQSQAGLSPAPAGGFKKKGSPCL